MYHVKFQRNIGNRVGTCWYIYTSGTLSLRQVPGVSFDTRGAVANAPLPLQMQG